MLKKLTSFTVTIFFFIILWFAIMGYAAVLDSEIRAAYGKGHVSSEGFIPVRAEATTDLAVSPPYEVINGVINTDRPASDFYVCVDELAVKTNPGDEFPIIFYLKRWEPVEIQEWSHGSVIGWARIQWVLWVNSSGLCRQGQ